MKTPLSQNSEPNVHGWERTASIAGGLLFLGKGLRRGGVGGLLQLAIGGLALARGMTGQCGAKRMITELKGSSDQQSTTGMQQPMGQPDTSPVTGASQPTGYDDPAPIATPAEANLVTEPTAPQSEPKDDPKPISGL